MSTWLITGCSTGIGRHLAQAVLARGWNAIVTARNPAGVQDIIRHYPDSSIALPVDVTDREQVAEAVRQGEARFGGIDVLVNSAGYGYRAAIEEAEEADVEKLFATNLFGPVALIKSVLPGMRKRRHGAIVNVSSIAARRTAPGSGYYSATKCALEGLSDGLRKEVGPLGIKVIVVEPGAFRTDFSGRSLVQSHATIADYAETAGRRRKENDKTDGQQPGDPARCAEVIIKAVEAPDSPFRLPLGADAIAVVTAELDAHRAELERWKAVSVTTDFPS